MNLNQTDASISVELWNAADIRGNEQSWQQFIDKHGPNAFHSSPRWLAAVCDGLKHRPYVVAATQNGRIVGVLPLCLVKSLLFGRFLVSLPYVNTGGLVAETPAAGSALLERAVQLADELNVRYLELRHELEFVHPSLTHQLTSKVHMRLKLPSSAAVLWNELGFKVRNKVRKGEKQDFSLHWGREDLLDDFFAVFSWNMRDLGTPTFGRRLFRSVLREFPDRAEFCVIRSNGRAVAAALLIHGDGITGVESASSLRALNSTNVNDLMYWRLLERAVERGQRVFDFGRSTVDSNTFVFKKKWGARPEPAFWQYYVRKGSVSDMRVESGKYNLAINVWKKLPIGLTRLIGPSIVRRIP